MPAGESDMVSGAERSTEMSDVVYAETCVCGAQLTIGRSAGTYLLVQRVRRWSDQHAACAHRYRVGVDGER